MDSVHILYILFFSYFLHDNMSQPSSKDYIGNWTRFLEHVAVENREKKNCVGGVFAELVPSRQCNTRLQICVV